MSKRRVEYYQDVRVVLYYLLDTDESILLMISGWVIWFSLFSSSQVVKDDLGESGAVYLSALGKIFLRRTLLRPSKL